MYKYFILRFKSNLITKLFLLILISLFIAVVLGIRSETPLQFFEKHIERNVIYNFSGESLPLYPAVKSTGKPIGILAKNNYLPYAYSGKTGNWEYVRYKNNVFSIRDNRVSKTHMVFGYPVKIAVIDKLFEYGMYVVAVLFIIILLAGRQRATHTNQAKKQKYDDHLAECLEEESKPYTDLELSTSQDSHDRLEILQASHDRLVKELKNVVEAAKIFGLDYNNPKYKNIIKGRKFELRVARSLEDDGCQLSEWTPDKGIIQGIKTASNTNPDLVVRKGGKDFAIECKYRGGFFKMPSVKEYIEHKDGISWANCSSVENYQEFSKDRNNMPVYLAIGFQGTADAPNTEYLLPLEEAIRISEGRDWQNNEPSNDEDKDMENEQMVFCQSKIRNKYKIQKGNYSKGLTV